MNRTTNRSHQHFILTRNGETIATDKIGSHGGTAAWSRLFDRFTAAAGTTLRHTDTTGRNFEGGFAIEGPFEKV